MTGEKVRRRKHLEQVSLGIGAMFGIYWVYLVVREHLPISTELKTLIGLFCLYGIGLGVYCYMIRRIPGQKLTEGKLSGKALTLCFLLQFSAIMILSVLTNLLTSLGILGRSTTMNTTSLYSLFILLVFNPIVEELVFRKIMADKLLQYGELFYMVASSFCFAIVHGVSLGVPQIVYTFILGMIWSYVMVKTGDIRLTIVLHALSNLFGGVILQFLLGIYMPAAGMYSILLMVLGAVGLSLFIKNKKKLTIDGENTLIRMEILRVIFSNKGILLYSGVTILFMLIVS